MSHWHLFGDEGRSGSRSSLGCALTVIATLGLGSMALTSLPALAQTDGEYFQRNVNRHVEGCMACHQAGGVAEAGGARLILSSKGGKRHANNYAAFATYLALPDVDKAFMLSKISGGSGHGGGVAHSEGTRGYNALADLATRIEEGVASGGGEEGEGEVGEEPPKDFWRGLVREPRETTLRRASIILGATLPTRQQIKKAKKNDNQLRKQVLKAMKGDGFHEFLIIGADDQLHTLGFEFTLFSDLFFPDYPEHIGHEIPTCDEAQEEAEDFYDFASSVHGCNYGQFIDSIAMPMEPLELIAYVVERNLSYKQILTANYTVANRPMNSMYEGGNSFPPLQPDSTITPEDIWTFKRSVDRGQPDFRDEVLTPCEPTCGNVKHGRQIDRPHAGVLTTPAFLSRYPTTDTNRNRARARWTYLHFLGVDIEKSAPRSTDPVALADTDNPTLKNPACTVCHERLDPVAGAFQNFSDPGHFRVAGTDSLADTYKFPEWYGGSADDTPYEPGDTWYRDMREPGLERAKAPDPDNSLQWLGERISQDPRFAKATVAFWWPAIMGAKPLEQPTETSDLNYEQQLNAFNAQQALMDELATKFRKKGYRAKQLFADMILSDWFRAEGFEAEEGEDRSIELAAIGTGRLLTPEELDRKNFALFGAHYRENNVVGFRYRRNREFRDKDSSIYAAFGGIDSAAVLERTRAFNPLMSNVAEKMAIEYACLVPVWDMNPTEMNEMRDYCAEDGWWEGFGTAQCAIRPPEKRPAIFTHVTKETVPNAANKTKIKKQIVALYAHLYGTTVKANDAGVNMLYEILETRRAEFEQQGWIDQGSCYIGNEKFNELIFDQQYDPQGMVAAWGSVIRAMMTSYQYVHE